MCGHAVCARDAIKGYKGRGVPPSVPEWATTCPSALDPTPKAQRVCLEAAAPALLDAAVAASGHGPWEFLPDHDLLTVYLEHLGVGEEAERWFGVDKVGGAGWGCGGGGRWTDCCRLEAASLDDHAGAPLQPRHLLAWSRPDC